MTGIAQLVSSYFSIGAGDSGPAIAMIQRALKRLGYEVTENGRFEETTGTAVREFQRAEGLEETGLVNLETAHAIDAKIHKHMAEGGEPPKA